MPLLQLRQSFDSQHALYPRSSDITVDVIAVHGLDENMTEAWTDVKSQILWLRDLLPNSLDVARVLTFGYNANATSFYGARSADRIQQHAQTLVADVQADRSLEGCSERPIVFICHGLGGILVKKALAYSSTRTSKNVEHLYSIFVSTYAILFFGTPHHGIDTRSWLPVVQNKPSLAVAGAPSQIDSQLLSAIETNSETLQAITDQFSSLMKQFHIFFFWEERETKIHGRKGYVVDECSAAPIIDNTERAGIDADHAEMIRFCSDQTSCYRTVIEALGRYCRSAPSVISRRWQQAAESLSRARSNEAFELAGTAFDIHNNNRPFLYERKLSERPRNKYFSIPQVVSSIFTGREDICQAVEEALLVPEDLGSSRQQRRYIVYGIGGSGKTQFCSKFAQDHRERFWGVFWIDATSAETAKQAFAKIGKLGGLEATQSAGKHWLSNAEEPWLLIINNADDPSLDLPNLFPEGERGHLLVTTRNPHFKIHGTVGATEFKGLKPTDALLLFLRAADSPRPWTPAVESVGHKIIDTLGYLALALIQAGALILQRICGMPDYLDFYNKFRRNVGARRSIGDPRINDQLTIYATWEHSLESLEIRQTEPCLDAAQLLSTVAFFHFDHIRVDIFTRALDNRLRSIETPTSPSIFSRLSRGLIARFQPPPILPTFLRQLPSTKDPYRIRRALHELRSFSLISYDGKDDSFSLHPVVHCWAKDRLDSGAQLLWAQVALNVLAESIQLPPNDTGETHEDFRRDILVHLDLCLQARPLAILDYRSLFGGYKLPFSLLLQTTWLFVFRGQALTAAKCGYVYLERGRFHEAASLFSDVKNALVQSRGYKDDKTMSVMLALAATLWGLGRLEEGVALQQTVVDSRTIVYGPDHAETLSAMDQLGKSFWLNGQYNEALKLQSVTMERTKATLGLNHKGTLNAMDNLGVTYGSWHKYKESKELHLHVLAIRRKTLGPTNLDTLIAMNNLSMALMDLGELSEAQGLINEVYEQRKAKLGKEHPYTLWALCNAAKVMSEQGLLEEAEEMLVGGLAAAKRSLGDDHLGVLMGVGELARVYARQGRLEASEFLSGELIQRLEASRGLGHPDTVFALFKVAQLYEMQGRIDKAVETCTLACERADIKLTKEHPMAKNIASQLKRLEECRKGFSGDKAAGGLHTASEVKPLVSGHHKSVAASHSDVEWMPNHLRSCKTY